ncbi:MAG TPA: glycosyltransferase family 4 protein [Acidimicrobiales bacterium]|nr:glycosyltransferase family 4 protein [Acidimicrobiales bacterium]
MRFLVVGQDFPWPVRLGSHLRLAEVINVASGLGQTDLFVFVPARRSEPCVLPSGLANVRVKTVVRPPPTWSPGRRLRWLTSSGLPLELVQEDSRDPRRQFDSWRRDAYDIAWFSKAASFELLGRPRLGPTVVDLDDLEDRKILGRLSAADADDAVGGIAARARRALSHVQARANASRWSRFQRSVAADVDRVVLCSENDAERSGLANVTVVPNGYEAPALPLGREEVSHPPTLLLAGSYGYPPNADAARFLVKSIFPRIKARVDDVTLRLVGEPSASVARLHRPPEITVVGWVPAIEPELARTDLVVVPVRYGSGTRVKILEAAAHRIPVVSTTLGAEGLGFEDGRHLLIADDPEGFAAACVRLLEEPLLRRRLVDEAQKAFLSHFQWGAADERIRTLVRSLAHQSGSVS